MKIWFQWMAFGRLLKFRTHAAIRMTLIAFLTSLIAAAGYCLAMATWLDVERMSRDVTMDVFVSEQASDSTLATYVSTIYALPGVAYAQMDRGDEVWESYTDRLNIEDDDLGEVVHLPTRIRLSMSSMGTSASRMIETERLVTMILGNDLVHIAWSPTQVNMRAHRREELRMACIIGSVLFLLLVMVSVVYSFRAEVHDAGTDLSIGAVLGAAPSTSAFPHFLVCVLTAVLGAGLVCGLLTIARPHVLPGIPWLSTVSLADCVKVVLVVMTALIVEGWLLTYAAARRKARHGKADRAS